MAYHAALKHIRALMSTTSLELAVIGNCQVSALVDCNASILWSCWPAPDADPAFCALLDPRGAEAPLGVFALDVAERASAGHHYERNTAIVQTVLADTHGALVRVTDFCPRFRDRGQIVRPPTIVRIVEPLAGRPVVRVRVSPARDWGARPCEVVSGTNHVQYATAGERLRLSTDLPLANLHNATYFALERAVTFVLGPDETPAQPVGVLARLWLERTQDYWHDWVRSLAIPFEWQSEVIRAAITLKLCTYEDTGAVLAALTTSIPEAPDSGRNWDYRYCWLRDAFFVVQALNRLGATQTMEGFLRYIDQMGAQGRLDPLQPLYRIEGTGSLEEIIVDTLAGYRGMGPVRRGNEAAGQSQHDVYGSLVLAATQYFFDERLAHTGDAGLFARLEQVATHALETFGQPDAGPWEYRNFARVHTFSAVMSWAACDRLARIAGRIDRADRRDYWAARAAELHEQILRRAWRPARDSFCDTLDAGEDLDATLLLLPELGFIAADDARFASTLAAIERELIVDGCVMRYRHADDFGLPHTAFNVCTFWYINALAATGQRERGRAVFEQMLARRNQVGLLSEDIDPRSGELWGNFPQTYSMVGIVNAAIRLSRPWEGAI
jgi:GH15 family glucan-1,4-alpha-glucosidase